MIDRLTPFEVAVESLDVAINVWQENSVYMDTELRRISEDMIVKRCRKVVEEAGKRE